MFEWSRMKENNFFNRLLINVFQRWICLSLDGWCVSCQARKLGEKKTVEALARQFQDQIERIMMEKSVVSAQSHIPSRYST